MLEKLAYIGTFVASVGNVGLVLFASVQFILLRRQVKLTQDQIDVATRATKIASESADAAHAGVIEALRTRIDDRAPRIVVVMEEPQWPPLIDRLGCAALSNGKVGRQGGVTQSYEASADVPFIADEHHDWVLWFRLFGIIINEGGGTARVRLGSDAFFVEASSRLLPVADTVPVPPRVGSTDCQEYLLRPGDCGVIEWACYSDIAGWIAAYGKTELVGPSDGCVLTVAVADSFDQGILDTILIDVSGRPLEPIEEGSGKWRVRRRAEEAQVSVTVHPTRRVYWSELEGGRHRSGSLRVEESNELSSSRITRDLGP